MVEKTACKGKYAMCNCGEVTVNGKVVVPASPVQLARRMTGLATGREWTCWRTGQSRDGPWEERRKRGELLARCVGCSEFGEEVSEEDGVEFLVCLELCECRRGGVARKVRAVFLVGGPVGTLALSVAVPVRPTPTASSQAEVGLLGCKTAVAPPPLLGAEEDLRETGDCDEDCPRGHSGLAHCCVARCRVGLQDNWHRCHRTRHSLSQPDHPLDHDNV